LEAQREKNDALCRKLRLQPSDHVLEIGTGWGGWALHAASTHGCHVTTVTISQQQYELARQRVAAAGLADRVDVQPLRFPRHHGPVRQDRLDRDARGGRSPPPGDLCQGGGAPARAGRVARAAVHHVSGFARYDQFRRGVDFIQKHIFPGSLLLSLNRMNDLLARAGGFVLHALDDFGPDYARTLALWRESFRARLDEVRALGFDERFIRKWTYYLCYCEAAFALRNISVVHTLHTRPNNPAL
jgi:cyclopropane-fatty-acyl-phospholipid synthase